MGCDKAQLHVDGLPLWKRQMNVLRMAGERPVRLVQACGQRALGPAVVVRDQFADAGPLAGLHAALLAGEASWVAVVAVDMPALTPSWFRRLFALCGPGFGAVVRTENGYEPLAAIYPRDALPEIEARLHRRQLSLRDCVATLVNDGRLRAICSTTEDAAQLLNWNTPADRELVPPPGLEPGYTV